MNVIGSFGLSREKNLLENFELSEDGTELFCTQSATGKRYRIDLAAGKAEEMVG